jgi:hypothetical protein
MRSQLVPLRKVFRTLGKARTATRLFAEIVRGGANADWYRYIVAEKITMALSPAHKFSEYGRLFTRDAEFLALYESFEGSANYHSLDRKYSLDQLMKLALLVQGDTAECGAFRGHSSYLICRRIQGTNRLHHVFDSFEGLSRPRTEDGSYWAEGNLSAAEDSIRHNLREFDFVRYYKGWIPTRFSDVEHQRFSFVHVDVDLYEPTRDSLSFFYPRLNPGGILICDDYGFQWCPGAKKAMDEFMADKPEPIVMLSTGQAFIQRAAG